MSKQTIIPYLDLKLMHAPIMAEIKREVDKVIDSHAFALGPAVADFEKDFAEYCGVNHCVGLNSGTSAVHEALICAGVQAGDEVITTPYTWISTSWVISYIGAKPVYVDIDPQNYCIDPSKIESAITPKTKAILPVHLYGHPADMDAILEVARRHGLAVVEDAAQVHGAKYKDKYCGNLADIASFSFYPSKNLGAFGEGGAITTNNAEWAERARALRDHAQRGRHQHVELGFNYRMEGIQAAVLRVKLRYLDRWNERRRKVAAMYHERLKDIPDVIPPTSSNWAKPVWHVYAFQHPQRDALRHHLEESGIQTGVHYPTPIHLQPAYAHLGYHEGGMPVTEALARQQVSLPMFPDMTEDQVELVANAIRSFSR